jgi:SAM-dependent MidA family methyltransferase
MEAALYGPGGFFVTARHGPAGHFRTSVHASPLFAAAVVELIRRLDEALGRPKRFDIVDVGAGHGELLAALLAGGSLDDRFHLTAVEKAAPPTGLDTRIRWAAEAPDGIVGLLLATEWLDNVPLDVADAASMRKLVVDPETGEERPGQPMDPADRMWAARWWPDGERIEIGWPRDTAWADAVSRVRRGAALAVDYGHLRADRPPVGTLTGFRDGRQVAPVPDGSCDVTAHVAMDAVAVAGGGSYTLVTQREALKALGVDGARPPLDLARTDPAGYLRALSTAGSAAELLDRGGLGGHWWLLHAVGLGRRGTMLG